MRSSARKKSFYFVSICALVFGQLSVDSGYAAYSAAEPKEISSVSYTETSTLLKPYAIDDEVTFSITVGFTSGGGADYDDGDDTKIKIASDKAGTITPLKAATTLTEGSDTCNLSDDDTNNEILFDCEGANGKDFKGNSKTVGTVKYIPNVLGVHTITIWHESDGSAGVTGSGATLEKSTTFSFTVSEAPEILSASIGSEADEIIVVADQELFCDASNCEPDKMNFTVDIDGESEMSPSAIIVDSTDKTKLLLTFNTPFEACMILEITFIQTAAKIKNSNGDIPLAVAGLPVTNSLEGECDGDGGGDDGGGDDGGGDDGGGDDGGGDGDDETPSEEEKAALKAKAQQEAKQLRNELESLTRKKSEQDNVLSQVKSGKMPDFNSFAKVGLIKNEFEYQMLLKEMVGADAQGTQSFGDLEKKVAQIRFLSLIVLAPSAKHYGIDLARAGLIESGFPKKNQLLSYLRSLDSTQLDSLQALITAIESFKKRG